MRKRLGGVVHRRQVLGPQVLAAAVQVDGAGSPVAGATPWRWCCGRRRCAARTGTPASCTVGPDRIVVGVRGRPAGRRARGRPRARRSRARAPRSTAASDRSGSWRGRKPDADEAGIARCRTPPSSGCARSCRRRRTSRSCENTKSAEREGREHELRREAEQVQRPRSLRGIHGPERQPPLGRGDHVLLECRGLFDVADAGLALLDRLAGTGAALVEEAGEVGEQAVACRRRRGHGASRGLPSGGCRRRGWSGDGRRASGSFPIDLTGSASVVLGPPRRSRAKLRFVTTHGKD